MNKMMLLLLFILSSCSSIPDLSMEERDRGKYLFNKRLKEEYIRFFGKNIFRNGSYVYAGPAFFEFNNFQLIKLVSLTPKGSVFETVYTEKDGSRHEYLEHVLNNYYGGTPSETRRDIRLEFGGIFQGFNQVATSEIDLVGELTCKKNVKCHLIPNIDFFLFKDPYDFKFRIENEGRIVTGNVELSNFTPTEATAIAGRMIYIGMGRKAAELAIGKDSRGHYMYGYYNVAFHNDLVSSFEFRMRHDLLYFIRR